MILRCPHHECRRTFDTEFNALQYHKDKGRGYICPCCHKWVGVGIYHAKPAPRVKPHGSKKERRRQREIVLHGKGLIDPKDLQ
jgi:hypothetical protein